MPPTANWFNYSDNLDLATAMLHHDNMGHPLRLVGAGGTILVQLVLAGTAIWQLLPI